MKKQEDLIKKGFRLLESEKANEIYVSLLNKELTVTELSKMFYPDLHSTKGKRIYKKRPHSVITRYIGAFNKLGWLNSKGDETDSRKTKYKAMYKPYFEYLRHKNPKVKLSKNETKFIEKFWFMNMNIKNLYKDLDSHIKTKQIEPYLRGIFILSQKEYKKIQDSKPNGEEILYIKLAKIVYDKFTIELIANYFKLLIEDLNKTSKNSIHAKEMLRLLEE